VTLRTLLDELDDRLRRFGAPVVEAFRPGLAEEQVREEAGAAGLAAPADVLAWWGWHDGVDGGVPPEYAGPGVRFRPESTIVRPWHALSLADALRVRRWYVEQAAAPPSWLPALHFEGQPLLAVDTDAGTVHVVDEGFPEPSPPQFASLEELAGSLVRLFDEGLVVPDAEDPRVPALDFARLPADLRRLATW
jgi:hypothetical protein